MPECLASKFVFITAIVKKNIFITGVSRGLGFALAERFLHNGHNVFGLSRTEAPEFAHSENFIPVIADITTDDCIEKIRTAVKSIPIHLLINNAGVGGKNGKLKNIQITDLERVFATHCSGVIRVVQAVTDNLLSAKNCEIINISSRMGSITEQYSGSFLHLPTTYEYRISKAAQNMVSACLKTEFGDKIKIYQVHPGRMLTGTAQIDAHLEPDDSAKMIISAWQQNTFVEGNGIFDVETGETYLW